MKTFKIYFLCLLLGVALGFGSCNKKTETVPLKVGLVTAVGQINDKGFNQMAYEGLVASAYMVSVDFEVKESTSITELANNIAYFTAKEVDLIITLGFDAVQPTLEAAIAYPEIDFLLLDNSLLAVPTNMACVTYQVDEVAFPAGFLAAFWAFHTDTEQPMVAYVGGPELPVIQQFTESYRAGVGYFNTKYSLNVEINGANASVFTDTVQGAQLADSLIARGADVVFACAGLTGNGALYTAKEANIAAIGVDTDQFYTIPEVGSVLLTSCIKRLDATVFNEVIYASSGNFSGGRTLNYNLANQGVDLANYHDFSNQIPDTIKTEVLLIAQSIMNGTLQTGWE